jgi:hypothetical protein
MLQQACDSKCHFTLAHPCTSKHLSIRHREAYIEGSGWGLLPPEHILKAHHYWLLGCSTSTFATEEHISKIAEKIPL